MNGNEKSDSFLGNILNVIDDETINEGDKPNAVPSTNFFRNNSLIPWCIYKNICNYVDSLFTKNKSSLEKITIKWK